MRFGEEQIHINEEINGFRMMKLVGKDSKGIGVYKG